MDIGSTLTNLEFPEASYQEYVGKTGWIESCLVGEVVISMHTAPGRLRVRRLEYDRSARSQRLSHEVKKFNDFRLVEMFDDIETGNEIKLSSMAGKVVQNILALDVGPDLSRHGGLFGAYVNSADVVVSGFPEKIEKVAVATGHVETTRFPAARQPATQATSASSCPMLIVGLGRVKKVWKLLAGVPGVYTGSIVGFYAYRHNSSIPFFGR
nr:hypothetical protein [Frankia sp. CiP3]